MGETAPSKSICSIRTWSWTRRAELGHSDFGFRSSNLGLEVLGDTFIPNSAVRNPNFSLSDQLPHLVGEDGQCDLLAVGSSLGQRLGEVRSLLRGDLGRHRGLE